MIDSKQKSEGFRRGGYLHHARIGNDGETVRCAANFTVAPDGSKRYQCGEPLGTRYIKQDVPVSNCYDETGELVDVLDDVAGFRLPAKFGYEPDGEFYRVTQRPHYRTEGYEIPVIFRFHESEGKAPQLRSKREKTVERTNSFWGEGGEFVLPIPILCPRCARLNLISVSLIENEVGETDTE
jgi:hypothetical protein